MKPDHVEIRHSDGRVEFKPISELNPLRDLADAKAIGPVSPPLKLDPPLTEELVVSDKVKTLKAKQSKKKEEL